uniref:Myb-like domain-containing protein n=1 Tax=Brassica oleracea var. oleracea TaxID=109376 RepID=A0A0D3C1P6_BRAOL
MTVYITGNHGLWVCKKRLRGTNRKFSAMRTFLESVRHLRHSKDSIVGNEQKGDAFWKRIVEYYNSSPLLVGTVPRELGQCKQRWARINDLICKRTMISAKLRILRKTADTPVAEPEDRPIGVKATKAAGKRKKTGKDEELTKLEGLMEIKKKISRQSLLESLLAKPEPLMGDEVDRRLNATLDKAVDEYFEDTYNNIVKNQTKKQSKRAYVERNREEGHTRLWNDYFSENPTFPPHLFRRRFRMNKAVFMRIVDRLSEKFSFFQQRRDDVGRLGLSPLQKCTAALRMLAYGCVADAVDEYLRLGESTSLSCLSNFTEGVIQLFGDEYLRRPTPEDLQRVLDIGEIRGFPGMIGSIDCMHWEWKNCPTAWKGQYTRGSGKPTIVLEAVALQDLWI